MILVETQSLKAPAPNISDGHVLSISLALLFLLSFPLALPARDDEIGSIHAHEEVSRVVMVASNISSSKGFLKVMR